MKKMDGIDLNKSSIKFIKSFNISSNKHGIEFIQPVDTVKINGQVLELYYKELSKSLAEDRSNYVICKISHSKITNAICPLCRERWSMKMECGIDRDIKEHLSSIVRVKSMFSKNDS